MGRLSRHKRVKPFDPFSRKHVARLDSHERNNPAVVADEQPLPRSLKRLMKERDRASQRRKSRKHTGRVQEDTCGEQRSNGDVEIGFNRERGEATSSYFDRIERETMTILHRHKKQAGKTGQKRKGFMKKKDSKKKALKQEMIYDRTTGFNQLQDIVHFGEVVQAPPVLNKPQKALDRQRISSLSLAKDRLKVIDQYRRLKQRTKHK